MIVKHVYFRLSDDQKLPEIVEGGKRLLTQIPGVLGVAFRKALPPEGPGRMPDYPYYLEVRLSGMEVHDAYLKHERHVEFAEKVLRPYATGLEREFFEEL